MYSLLIVDDHKHQVESLATTMPWDQFGITTIHKAYNGHSAMEIMRDHPIDILITDIRMPGMSGLELIQYVNDHRLGINCILLTGYAEFEYAKKAIELNAIDYFIKPVRDEVILATVGRIVEKRNNERQQERHLEYTTSVVHRNLPLLKENLLLDLLQERGLSKSELADKLGMYRIPFADGDIVRIAAIKLDPSFYDSYSAEDMKLFEFAVLNMAEELLSAHFHTWTCKTQQGNLAMLLLPASEDGTRVAEWTSAQEKLLVALAHKLAENVDQYLRGNISVYLSNPAIFPTGIYAAYSSIVASWMKSNPQGAVVTTPEASAPRPIKPLKSLYQSPMIIQLMDNGNEDKLHERLADIFGELEDAHADSQAHLREAYLHLLSCFTYLAHKKGIVLEDIVGTSTGRAENKAIHSAKLLRTWSHIILDALFNKDRFEPLQADENHRQLVGKIHAYIDLNLGKDVTLQSIGDSVYLNGIYVSQIYKEITGENLSEYILRTRMERAKTLLVESSSKIYEITEKVGYQSPQHFIRTFKKYYGVTPEYYRKR
ncbi:response regulator [Cohnella sp. GCM10027633]|uniref:response regulator n=1 Tax=unclassified Cohnella TaxID=2636738 RepID=UPI00364128A5